MATVNKIEDLTAEQQQARSEWFASLPGRQTKEYEAAQQIGRIGEKPVKPSRIAKALQSNQKTISLV